MNRSDIEELVLRWLSAVQHGQYDVFAELTAAEVVDLNQGRLAAPGSFEQRARAVHAAFEIRAARIDQLLIDGDAIAWRWSLDVCHTGPFLGEAATGKALTLSGTNFQRLSEGRVTAHFTLVDAFGALSQIRAP